MLWLFLFSLRYLMDIINAFFAQTSLIVLLMFLYCYIFFFYSDPDPPAFLRSTRSNFTEIDLAFEAPLSRFDFFTLTYEKSDGSDLVMIIRSIYIAQLLYKYTLLHCDDSATLWIHNYKTIQRFLKYIKSTSSTTF